MVHDSLCFLATGELRALHLYFMDIIVLRRLSIIHETQTTYIEYGDRMLDPLPSFSYINGQTISCLQPGTE